MEEGNLVGKATHQISIHITIELDLVLRESLFQRNHDVGSKRITPLTKTIFTLTCSHILKQITFKFA